MSDSVALFEDNVMDIILLSRNIKWYLYKHWSIQNNIKYLLIWLFLLNNGCNNTNTNDKKDIVEIGIKKINEELNDFQKEADKNMEIEIAHAEKEIIVMENMIKEMEKIDKYRNQRVTITSISKKDTKIINPPKNIIQQEQTDRGLSREYPKQIPESVAIERSPFGMITLNFWPGDTKHEIMQVIWDPGVFAHYTYCRFCK